MGAGSVRIDGSTLLLGEGVRIRFVRTLRLPETGTHALPPGLGDFPLRRVEDYPGTVPPEWLAKGGVMLPVYLREAMWLSFGGTLEPAALQVGVGKVCAVSGERWTGRPARTPQNYVVLPRQPWLDGINSGEGTVRQFVAVPLGLGATVEGQVTGEETTGGVQLQAFPLRTAPLAAWRRAEEERLRAERERLRAPLPRYGTGPGAPGGYGGAVPMPMAAAPGGFPQPGSAPARAAAVPAPAMGLGAGGSMRQEVYRDDRPLSDWDEEPAARVFVHLVTPPAWRRITGEEAPPSPVDRAAYTRAGLPWFDYYDESGTDLAPAGPLGQVKPVGEWLGDDHTPWSEPVPGQIKPLGNAPRPGKPVQDGDW
ncbi:MULTISPECIES: hypothetical protein [Streptomyces]|uniref:hypothetical protein n=1 Tax=Streptomyces TaxID=1883 RepID=UPI00226F5D13|nr:MULTISPECIES: hypothetical protein [unclassified Streptomyces]MCY0947445.1 hypothetical protein [Streptomyces sp. H34-AA3]MCZ4088205.1 hypothetical protein [Streptomyces sp. H34-S5]